MFASGLLRAIATIMLAMVLLSPTASAQTGDFKQGGEVRTEAEATPPADNPGLIEEGSYISPQFGLAMSWGPSWQLGPADDPAVVHANGGYWSGSVDSVPDVGDIVFLMDTATESAVLTLGFSYLSPNVSVPDVLAYMQEPDYLTHNLFISADADILLIESTRTSVAVLARDAAPNENHFVYQMMVLDPRSEDFGFWVGLDLYDPSAAATILSSIEHDIEVEDNEIFGVLTVEDMLEAMEDTPASANPLPTSYLGPTFPRRISG